MLTILGGQPDNLGLQNGKLRSCPDTPNCVCSQSHSPQHSIAPIRFHGSVEDARHLISQAVLAQPRTRIVTEDGNYIHAESRSWLFRFIDDVELYIDPREQLIQIRSASRLGISDLGVNRARVESIRTEFDRLAKTQSKHSARDDIDTEGKK